MKFKATLTHPVGINASVRIGFNKVTRKRVIIKSKKAQTWESSAILELKAAGFTPQPERMYWASIIIDLYTSRLDIDAPIKYTLDLVMKSLSNEKKVNNRRVYIGVDDKWNGQLIVHKHFTSPKKDQRLEIQVELIPVKDKGEFNKITKARRKKCLTY